jgi:hypothetical protein
LVSQNRDGCQVSSEWRAPNPKKYSGVEEQETGEAINGGEMPSQRDEEEIEVGESEECSDSHKLAPLPSHVCQYPLALFAGPGNIKILHIGKKTTHQLTYWTGRERGGARADVHSSWILLYIFIVP